MRSRNDEESSMVGGSAGYGGNRTTGTILRVCQLEKGDEV